MHSDLKRIIKIEEHLYSKFSTYHTDYEFYYSQNRLDSIVSGFTDRKNKDVLKFQYSLHLIEAFNNPALYDTSIKAFQYDFDSISRLSRFIRYGNNKVINEDKYSYDNGNKLYKVESILRGFWVDGESNFISFYSLNDFDNIDTIYEYCLDDNVKELYSIKTFKHDDKPNPFKGLLYFGISERYFNANNITKEYILTLHDSLNIKDSIIYNYLYENGYLVKYLDDDIFESDSLVQIYYYSK